MADQPGARGGDQELRGRRGCAAELMPATARRCLLIGGRSNTGKSTVANVLAQQLAGVHISTDTLGRHPGRPWGTVPTHVAEHYRAKSDDDIFAAVVAHQRGLQPAIAALVREHETNS